MRWSRPTSISQKAEAIAAQEISPCRKTFIPEEVYDNLLATVRANTEPFQRYISLRNRVLGLDKSYMYDLFLPIVPDSTKKYSFDEAYELMLKATAILGEDYTALVKRSHEERWCDVYPKQCKVSGALLDRSL